MAGVEVIRFRFNEAEVQAFLNDPDGPVAHLMRELGLEAEGFARAKVRKRASPSPGKSGRPGTSAPPGSTAASIDSALHANGFRIPWAEVSADMVGLFLEKGTRPHPIDSYGPWSLSNYGTGYFGYHVNHPGTRPYPFLTTALWALQGQV
jgi:hypothetical protein